MISTENNTGEHYSLKNRISILLVTTMVFIGAFLLFSMEPLVGRLLTPCFGGASHVWLTCLMFFQAMLFLGYLSAHLLEERIGVWHLILLIIPLFCLPLGVNTQPDPNAPFLAILTLLLFHVALPFIALSTTAVVAQSWFFRSPHGKNREPYPLYGASNAGSLIALLGYVFIVEPLFGIRTQRFAWSGAYVFYVILVSLTWLTLRPDKMPKVGTPTQDRGVKSISITPVEHARWLFLSGLPSAFLLAVTSFITLEVGSFPFVWVIPLALYLGSFIVTFRSNGGVPRFLKIFWLEVLLAGVALYALGQAQWLVILGHLCAFFMICLVSHGLLYERRPPPRHLTYFYLTSAFGGWVGGALVALVAPFALTGLFEYPILLVLFGGVFWWNRDKSFTAFWPKASRWAAWTRMAAIGIILFPVAVGVQISRTEPAKYRHRNFYGTYRIVDESGKNASLGVRKLMHGKTLHGAQLLDPGSRMTPISYYYEGGPFSDVYGLVPSPRRLAVVGLGSGAISAYMRHNDMLTFYEIDPDNEKIARTWFTFLDEGKGKVAIIVGDGRLSLQSSERNAKKYDLILIDAFTGDGIPTHLLTKEALLTYLDRLTANGIILLHLSNRYYDLRPMVKATANEVGLSGVMNKPVAQSNLKTYQIRSRCVALTKRPELLQPLISKGWVAFGKEDTLDDVAPWTDDYINILSPLSISLRAKFNTNQNPNN
jgi:hypothetical protein